jgi:uncharacterized protein YbaA (DUF1428 family)
MSYVDGFVIPVPNDKKDDYRDLAEKFGLLLKEFGALRVVENWGDDVPDGKVTDFRRAVAAQPSENIVFSWVVWPSKDVRDAAHVKMHEDPRMKDLPMPFDGKRMIFGGFTPMLDLGSGA